MRNILSVDVEDYFHPSEVQAHAAVPMDRWSSLPARVEYSTRRTLELVAEGNARCTFFILGWVAENYPGLVREIAAAGHEIACHSYAHRLVYEMTPAEFRADTERARKAIEDAAGAAVRAYRAPSYSITRQSLWALEVLAECGFTHDSSIYPVAHDRYGIPDFERHPQRLDTPSGAIVEVPVAVARLSAARMAPVGGGAYLRLLPYRYIAAGIRHINREDRTPACIYFHPWEIDPDQPRLITNRLSRIRTYMGLRSMASKLSRLMREFQFGPLTEVCPKGN